MIPSIRLTFSLVLLFPILSVAQYIDGKFVFPDIPGYHTLKCDFHMHTVFSDGVVWPTVRVQEAVKEGLDAIAISEHLEYWSHKNYLKGDHNSSYEIAKPYADKNGLILIKACEITKDMPPGHFNFLFIKDANAIDSVEWKKAIMQASEQGAFIFWNHPGWRMENTIPVWYDEHSWLMSEGLLDGIEIVNENEYYPLAWQWCIDSNLTILGNSDIHAPVDYFYDRSAGEHRPITLVFAKEKNEDGIREALENARTAIFYQEMVIGEEDLLRELFYQSTEIFENLDSASEEPHSSVSYIVNKSSAILKIAMLVENYEEPVEYWIPPGETIPVELSEIDLRSTWKVKNFLVSPGKSLIIDNLGSK